jgi:DNA-binding response OmpR family regulator
MSRILIVEDDPTIAFGLKVDFETEGYVTAVEANGQRAVERARSDSFDLILLDVMLPGKDGFEVCRDLRRGGSRVPIILLTARTQEAEKVMGLDAGADDYVTKPFSPRELRARVRAVLRRSEEPGTRVFRFGDSEVDFDRCEYRRDGVPVELTSLDFRLLSVFVENRGRCLKREQLLDKVWGRGACVTDRVVDNHIVALRKKIETDPALPRHLVSVRGMGYRFDA